MRTIEVNLRRGYIFNEQTKRLEFFEWDSCNATVRNGVIKYHGMLNGKEHTIDSSVAMYKDASRFEQGKQIEKMSIECFPYTSHLDENDNIVREGFVFRDGQAKRIEVSDMEFVIEADGNVKTPEIIYESCADVYKNNDYTEIDSDGNTILHECIASKMRFTDKQQCLIDNLKKAIKECEDNGLDLFYNTETEDLNVIRTDKVNAACLSLYESENNKCEYIEHFAKRIHNMPSVNDDFAWYRLEDKKEHTS